MPVGAVAVVGLTVAVSGDDSEKNLAITPERPAAATATSTVTASKTPRAGKPSPVSASPKPTATPKPSAPSPRPTSAAPQPSQPPATQDPPAPTARPVPNVVGLSVDEAAALLAQSGFGFAEVCVRSRDEGVVHQQPAAGQEWNVGGEVALYVAERRCDDHGWDDDDRHGLS